MTMPFSAFRFIALLAILSSIFTGRIALGQGGSNMVTEFSGTLKSVTRNGVMVTRDDGTDVTVMSPDTPTGIRFVADAKPAFLTRGTLVRFSGTFMANGQATEPISRVEAFQPVNPKLVKGHVAQQFIPGVHKDRHGEKDATVAKVIVVGALMGLTETGIMVQAGNVSVQAPLASDVKLMLNVNNFSLAQEGDPVKVSGFYQPPNETLVKAESILVNPTRVYGEADDGKPKRKTRAEILAERAAEKAAKADAAAIE